MSNNVTLDGKSDSDATLVCRNVAEDARSLIDDEVHRDCEYYVYSQLRDCIDVIGDDYERLKVENAKLRELVRAMSKLLVVADWPSIEDDERASECIRRTEELGVEVDE